MSGDDRQLLLRTRRGDEQAARSLWSAYSPRMLAYSRSILGGAHAEGADDVIQSVFVSILSVRMGQLRQVEDVPSWLLRLTRNASLNHLRTIRRERARSVASGPRPVEGAASPILDDRLTAAIDALPRRHREPLILRHIAGLTFDQLALALNINRNTAASRYRTALATLRQTLGATGRAVDRESPQPAGEHHV